MRRVAVLACAIVELAGAARAEAQSWDELAARQAVIAGIDIRVADVFDTGQPGEHTWIGRAANAVHVRTRSRVVGRELLFAVGDVVDVARIHETERNLRRYPFVREAWVVPARVVGRQVWVRVEVADAWSLNGSVSFGRTGGATTYGADVDESSVGGTGKRLRVGYGHDRERSTREAAYLDPQWLGSRWTVALRAADLSDGLARSVALERPFYSIETPYAIGGIAGTAEYTQTLYHLGQPVLSLPARRSTSTLFGSRAVIRRDRSALRFGLTLQDLHDEFGPATVAAADALPVPDASERRLRGWSGTWAFVQDRPATFENFAGIAHTEDYDLGWNVSGQAGYFATRLGSTVSAPFGGLTGRKGWRIPARGIALAAAWANGRRELAHWRAAAAGLRLTTYARPLSWHTLAARAEWAMVADPDPDGWLYLDSQAGLRGYPDHFLAGDRRVSLSAEDRVITSWRMLGLVQVGFVAYADAGAVRRLDTGRWSRTYADAGAGLRFGSLKGARGNILQASIAFPLVRGDGIDGMQLVLGNAVGF
jgi:hypothetical protein